jgi:hypothetical protein
MHLSALAVNTLWSASNLPSYRRFRRASRDPQKAQWLKLSHYLSRNAHTAFGKAHGFGQIRSYEEFARRVPLAGYHSFEPWIERIRDGETKVLTSDAVTHLVPTSGSTGARKLIPFTCGLQQEFNAAVAPWLVNLHCQCPGIAAGPAYWSITPAFQVADEEASVVPIGFDSDTAYLGGNRRRLAEAIMAVPNDVQRARTPEEFRYQTLLHLLRCPELRLISVWHPSFLTLLLDALPSYWTALLDGIIPVGTKPPRSLVERAEELRSADPFHPEMIWPRLKVISCWGEGNAELTIAELQRRFPSTRIQRKGLLATEAFVTFPFAHRHVLAVTSHFFEFIDSNGEAHLAHELKPGEPYEVVVTTGGGLYRYRLQDSVLVTGSLQKTPALRFCGRLGNVSDRFGEKISEGFVNSIVPELLDKLPALPRFLLIAPEETRFGVRYTLYLEGRVCAEITQSLDDLLRRNPQYALCRNLGQLQAPGLFLIHSGGYESFARELSKGGRLGDIKPCSLSIQSGWSDQFIGHDVPYNPKLNASV